jgi:hypothetical protein
VERLQVVAIVLLSAGIVGTVACGGFNPVLSVEDLKQTPVSLKILSVKDGYRGGLLGDELFISVQTQSGETIEAVPTVSKFSSCKEDMTKAIGDTITFYESSGTRNRAFSTESFEQTIKNGSLGAILCGDVLSDDTGGLSVPSKFGDSSFPMMF